MSDTNKPQQSERVAPPKSVADFVSAAEARLSQLIRRHFRFLTVSAVGAAVLLVGVFAAATFLTRAPSDPEMLSRLEESNRNLSALATALLREPPGSIAAERALEAVVAQAEIHRQAVAQLRQTQEQPGSDTLAVLQLVGGAAVLTLLGILGLQRLQNIDAEINNLRESITNQVQARTTDIEKVLGATIDDEVRKRFRQMEEKYRQLSETADKLTAKLQQVGEESEQKVKKAAEPIMAFAEAYNLPYNLPQKTFGPKANSLHGSVGVSISEIASVEQAHRLAALFNADGDPLSARKALSQIVERDLPGEPDDFHNAHTEAMRMEEVQLALKIVEAGLNFFPDHYELVPDKVRVLQSVGRAQEARTTIEEWIEKKPNEFTRSWRGAVFYADLFDALEMNDDAAGKLEAALRLAVEKLPREVKPVTALARFYLSRGREEEAIKVFEDGLKKNPFSQQLNYNLGELYLRRGDVNNAKQYLEKALWVDYQEQYQHDVNQYAVRATLAQAYEAAGDLEKAELLYRNVLAEAKADDRNRNLVIYSRNRLAAIALRQGKLPGEDGDSDAAAHLNRLLREAIMNRAEASSSGE